jgi:hypothetical protein
VRKVIRLHRPFAVLTSGGPSRQVTGAPVALPPREIGFTISLLALLLLVAGLSGGCSAMHIQPWDRDLLSEKKMRFVPSPVENEMDEHIYFSKEGSTGGQGVGGGGCGCN